MVISLPVYGTITEVMQLLPDITALSSCVNMCVYVHCVSPKSAHIKKLISVVKYKKETHSGLYNSFLFSPLPLCVILIEIEIFCQIFVHQLLLVTFSFFPLFL